MFRSPRKLVALTAAACYGLVALASHELHHWVGVADHGHGQHGACHAEHCHDGDSHDGHQACCPAEAGQPSVEQHAAGHDPDHCSICALVAKLKTSRLELAAALAAVQAVAPAEPLHILQVPHAPPRILSARGPPADQA